MLARARGAQFVAAVVDAACCSPFRRGCCLGVSVPLSVLSSVMDKDGIEVWLTAHFKCVTVEQPILRALL